ncbi:MAG: dfrA [Burkholderiaceae bacterium]|nr:dfrA [Burkholderiaceae bacterium]
MQISNPRVTIIAAISQNRGLGKNNQLLWKIPQDLSFFKKVTSGSPIIMGNKTYYSIGRPLPNRLNIVLSRTLVQHNIKIDGCEVVSSIKDAIALATNYLTLRKLTHFEPSEQPIDSKEESIILATHQLAEHNRLSNPYIEPEIFIIGGAQIYANALKNNIVDRVLLTEIHQTSDADVFFPVLEENQWQEVWRESHFDEQNNLSFDFVDYRKLTQ